MPEAMPSTSATNYFPIAELTPYHKGWTIKARVVNKSITRTFNKVPRAGESAGQGSVGGLSCCCTEPL